MNRTTLSFLLCSLAFGCTAVEPEDIDDAPELEDADELGATELTTVIDPVALGEPACATTSLADPNDGAAITMSDAPNCGFAYDHATSLNTSYDPTGCDNQWVTQVTGTLGEPLNFTVAWAGPTLTATNCAYAYLHATAFGYDATGGRTNAFWEPIDSVELKGRWIDVGVLHTCVFEPVDPSDDGELDALGDDHPYSAVRVAALAHDFLFTKHRVKAGIWHGPGPC